MKASTKLIGEAEIAWYTIHFHISGPNPSHQPLIWCSKWYHEVTESIIILSLTAVNTCYCRAMWNQRCTAVSILASWQTALVIISIVLEQKVCLSRFWHGQILELGRKGLYTAERWLWVFTACTRIHCKQVPFPWTCVWLKYLLSGMHAVKDLWGLHVFTSRENHFSTTKCTWSLSTNGNRTITCDVSDHQLSRDSLSTHGVNQE